MPLRVTNVSGPCSANTNRHLFEKLAAQFNRSYAEGNARTEALIQEAKRFADEVEAAGIIPELQAGLDVCVGPGSWRALYAKGAFSVLRELHARNLLQVHRFRGASGGAQAASVMSQIDSFTEDDMRVWLQAAPAFQAFLKEDVGFSGFFLDVSGVLRASMDILCGHSVVALASDRLYLLATEFRFNFPRQHVFGGPNTFKDRDYLLDAILASSQIPCISNMALTYHSKSLGIGGCMDGALTEFTPRFKDMKRKQLMCNLSALPSPGNRFSWILYPTGDFDSVIRLGQEDVAQLLMGKLLKEKKSGSTDRMTIQDELPCPGTFSYSLLKAILGIGGFFLCFLSCSLAVGVGVWTRAARATDP